MSKAKLKLTFASSDYEHVRDLTMGPVEAEGIELNCLTLQIEEMFHRFINFNEFDVSEISSGKYTSLISQGDDRPCTSGPTARSRSRRIWRARRSGCPNGASRRRSTRAAGSPTMSASR